MHCISQLNSQHFSSLQGRRLSLSNGSLLPAVLLQLCFRSLKCPDFFSLSGSAWQHQLILVFCAHIQVKAGKIRLMAAIGQGNAHIQRSIISDQSIGNFLKYNHIIVGRY